jgi:UDP-N-acetylglucosamine 2-epimerase (non-hydrolysing)
MPNPTTVDLMVLAGTRPEGIKVAPLISSVTDAGRPGNRLGNRLGTWLVDTGQQPGRVAEAVAPFGLKPDVEVALHRPTGSLPELAAGLTTALDEILTERRPAAVVVQGDTMTALIGGLVAFWHRIPVVHLEAGLRTRDNDRPFPEEVNRAMLARFTSLHLAPTDAARRHLLDEQVPAETIHVIGNTVVDAVRHLIDSGQATPPEWLDRSRPMIVTTIHRRENWGAGVAGVAAALTTLAHERPDVQIVVVTHPNPALSASVRDALRGAPAVRVLPSLPYEQMLGLLSAADVVITDSGGLQEEAATLGLPVVVTREQTERPEALVPGYGQLVGTDPAKILASTLAFLDTELPPHGFSPFGDGHSGPRAAAAIADFLLNR